MKIGVRSSSLDLEVAHRFENAQIEIYPSVEDLLKNLSKLDCGQIPIFNSVIGPIEETMNALGRYKYEVLEEYDLPADPLLMSVDSDIREVILHPEEEAIYGPKIRELFPQSKFSNRLNHYAVAKLKESGLATIGSVRLAEMYCLKTWQLSVTCKTTFILVKNI
jgi:prephenate dehydratase